MATAEPRADAENDPACPLLDAEARERHAASLRAAREFTRALAGFLEDHTLAERAAFIKTTVGAARTLFQPWVMEILYVIANQRAARFNEMHALLGLSSRTLSDKLKLLESEGLVERTVHDTRPVRVDYTLTRRGAEATALASPLFAHLNDQAWADRRGDGA